MSTNITLPLGINHFITLEKAKEMTAKFRSERDAILIPELREQNILSICETFDRGAFDTVLAETGCLGLRVYFGMTPELKVRVIVVGVNANNEDILPAENLSRVQASSEEGGDDDEGHIIEEGAPCPDICPDPPL